jgi:hypothetical protein
MTTWRRRGKLWQDIKSDDFPSSTISKRLVGFVALADLGRSEEKAAQGALKGISEHTGKDRQYETVGRSPADS